MFRQRISSKKLVREVSRTTLAQSFLSKVDLIRPAQVQVCGPCRTEVKSNRFGFEPKPTYAALVQRKWCGTGLKFEESLSERPLCNESEAELVRNSRKRRYEQPLRSESSAELARNSRKSRSERHPWNNSKAELVINLRTSCYERPQCIVESEADLVRQFGKSRSVAKVMQN